MMQNERWRCIYHGKKSCCTELEACTAELHTFVFVGTVLYSSWFIVTLSMLRRVILYVCVCCIVGSSGQGYLPAAVQYPSLLAGNEVGRVAGPGRGGASSSSSSSNNKSPTCSSRGHHGRCFMLHHHHYHHHHHHHHHRTRRPAGPPKALPPPAGDGSSPPSLPASPPTPDLSHFSTVGSLEQLTFKLHLNGRAFNVKCSLLFILLMI